MDADEMDADDHQRTETAGAPSRSRRAVLAGAVTGVAVLASDALAKPASVLAIDPNDLALGTTNAANDTTSLRKSGPGVVLQLWADATSGVGLNASGGLGAFGGGHHVGVAGGTEGGTGVQGWVGSHGRTAPMRRGVAIHGYAAYEPLPGDDTAMCGVVGEARAGIGVDGVAEIGTGVHGRTTDGGGRRACRGEPGGYGARGFRAS